LCNTVCIRLVTIVTFWRTGVLIGVKRRKSLRQNGGVKAQMDFTPPFWRNHGVTNQKSPA
jgi:hypothetical protein